MRLPIPAFQFSTFQHQDTANKRSAIHGSIAVVLFVIVLIALAAAVLGWMLLAPGIASHRMQMRTGFSCKLSTYAANPFGGSMRMGEFILHNPSGFTPRVFLFGRNLTASGGSAEELSKGMMNFKQVHIELDDIVLARDTYGRDNFSVFAASLPPMRIRELVLVIGSKPAEHGQPKREAFAKTYRNLESLRPVLADLAQLAVNAEPIATAMTPLSPLPSPAVQQTMPTPDNSPQKIEFRSR